MSNSWGGVYYLKSDTEISDIWDCIKEMSDASFFPENFPDNFCYEADEQILYWSVFKNNSSLVEFCYTATSEDKRRTLRIVFDNNVKKVEIGNVHTLFYKETSENMGDLFFVWKFFPLMRQFVPKSYFQIKITDDKTEKEKSFFKKNINNSDVGKYVQSDSHIKKKFAPELYSQIKIADDKVEKEKLLKKNINNNGVVKNPKDNSHKDASTSKFPKVHFFANENGDFFFPREWIERLSKDLWFTNAEFKKCYGLLPHINKSNLIKRDSELKRMEKESKKSTDLKKEFDEFIERLVEKQRSKYKQFSPMVSRVKMYLGSQLCNEIKPIEQSISTENEYEELRMEILASVDYRYLLDKALQNDFQNLLENDINESKVFDEKVAFHLKEKGLDNNNLENILATSEKLKTDNDFLSKQIESLKSENQQLKDVIEKNINLSYTTATEIKNEFSEKNAAEIEKLKNRIAELEGENKNLKNEKSNLQARIKSLENKISDKNKTEENCVLNIPCDIEELFTDEITDYLYKILYEKLYEEKSTLPTNKDDEITRKADVIKNLLEHKIFDWEKTETNQKIMRIEKVLRNSRRPSLKDLSHEGFVQVENTKNHPKVYFYEDRYQITFSLTPSDGNVSGNRIREISERFFLV